MFGKKFILSGLGLLSVLGGSRLIGDDYIVNNQIEPQVLRAGGFNPGGTSTNSFDRSVTFQKQNFNVSQLSDMATINANSYTDGLGEKYFTISKKYIAKEGYLILKFTDDSFYSDSLLLSDSVTHGFKNPDTSSGNCRNTYGIYIYYANGFYHELNANRVTDMFSSISEDIGSASGIEVSSTHPCYAIIDLVESRMAYDTDLTLAFTYSKKSSVVVVRNTALTYPSDLYDGKTKDIFIDVDKGFTKDAIINSISAKDLFGKEVPVTVTSGLDTFTPTMIGVYTLKLKATDDYGQSATATLLVHIVDYVDPQIKQIKTFAFTADKGQSLKYADLTNYVSVSDNGTSHGSTLTTTYTYDGVAIDSSWTKTFVASDVGTHDLVVTAVDGSGNDSKSTFKINVNDGTAPVLSRIDGQPVSSDITIGVSKTFTMTLKDVTQLFKAIDNVDGNVSETITGLTDNDKNFFSNTHKVGTYTLTLTCRDKVGNVTNQALTVKLVADLPPVFIIADTLVYTDTNTKLSVTQLNMVVSNAILADQTITSLSVDASDYIGHEDEPGIYHVTYDYTTAGNVKSARRLMASADVKSGSFDIIVTEPSANEEEKEKETKEENWFVSIFTSIIDWFIHLGNWFRGIFTHFDFTCWLDNDEFDLRYPVKEEVETSSDDSTSTPVEESTAEKTVEA